MTLVLTKAELERMRAEARIGGQAAESKEQKRRAELKRLSNERVKNWPNTLEALRKKKESFMKEREDAEELRRQQQDKEVLKQCILIQVNFTKYFAVGIII